MPRENTDRRAVRVFGGAEGGLGLLSPIGGGLGPLPPIEGGLIPLLLRTVSCHSDDARPAAAVMHATHSAASAAEEALNS
eukprot:scaffold122002_cov63-Phaeocystis_antarctica.AAC.2